MFFSSELLHRRRGRFGVLWIAATRSHLLTRREIQGVNIRRMCKDLIDHIMVHVPRGEGQRSRPRFSLYLASQLTYGVIYVYSRKVDFFHRDLQNFINNYKVSLQSIRDNVALPPRSNRGKRVVTLEDRINGDPEFGFIEPPIKRVRTESMVETGEEPAPAAVDDEAFDFDELMRQARDPFEEYSPPRHLPPPGASPDRSLTVSPHAITMLEPLLPMRDGQAPTGIDFGFATDDDLGFLAEDLDEHRRVPEETPLPLAAVAAVPPGAPERPVRPVPPSVTPVAEPRTLPTMPPAVVTEIPVPVGQPSHILTPPTVPARPSPERPPSVGEPPSYTPPLVPRVVPELQLEAIDVVPRPIRRRRRRLIVDDEIQLPREDVHRGLEDYHRDQRQRDILTFQERQNERATVNDLFRRPGRPGNFRVPALHRLFLRHCRVTIEPNGGDSPLLMLSPLQVQMPMPQLEDTETTGIDLPRDPSTEVSRVISESGIVGTPDVSAQAADISGPAAITTDVDDIRATLPPVPEQEEPAGQDMEIQTELAGISSQTEDEDELTLQDKERRAMEVLLQKLKEETKKFKAILTFRDICPPDRWRRMTAAKTFSRLLAMNKLAQVYLDQHAPYEDIYIYVDVD